MENNNSVHNNQTITDILDFNNKYSAVLVGIIGFGVLLSLGLIILFVRFRKTPLVRASNIIVSLAQLVSHIFLFLSCLTFFQPPTIAVCISRPISIGIFFTLIVAVTMIKTQKLVFIFHAKIRVSRKQIQISKTMEIFLIFLMLCVQLCIATISFLLNKTRVTSEHLRKEVHLLKCDTEEEFVIQLLFAFLLILMSLLQAFRARSLPKNFNETKFITVAMFTSVILVAIFLPFRLNVVRQREKLYLDIFMVTLINTTQLTVMYSCKAWVILMRPQRNTPAVFKHNLQIHAMQDMTKDLNGCVIVGVDSPNGSVRSSVCGSVRSSIWEMPST